jgi:tRNA U54 and U55 pseudouridine synthase Pus10
MLGAGRPFILEIHNARRAMPPAEELRLMEAAVEEVGFVSRRALAGLLPRKYLQQKLACSQPPSFTVLCLLCMQ